MRKSAYFIVAGILFTMGMGATTSFAKDEHEKDRFRFSCRFQGEDGKKDKDKGGRHFCTAEALVCDFRDSSWDIMSEEHHERCRDRLAVQCDGKPIYADGAIHRSFGEFQFLSGLTGNPVLKYSSNRPHERDDSFITGAWLKLGEHVLDGFCAVEKEHDHHNGPAMQ